MAVKGFADFDLSKIYSIPGMLKFERSQFEIPEITTAEDLLSALKKNNEDLLNLLEQQHEANTQLNTRNSRLTWLAIFLATIPVLFGVLGYWQMERSNQITKSQLQQYEVLIEKIPSYQFLNTKVEDEVTKQLIISNSTKEKLPVK